MVLNVFNPNIWETEAGGLWVQGQPEVHNKFQVSLAEIETISKIKIKKKISSIERSRDSFY
jgi:hypothetical protein